MLTPYLLALTPAKAFDFEDVLDDVRVRFSLNKFDNNSFIAC